MPNYFFNPACDWIGLEINHVGSSLNLATYTFESFFRNVYVYPLGKDLFSSFDESDETTKNFLEKFEKVKEFIFEEMKRSNINRALVAAIDAALSDIQERGDLVAFFRADAEGTKWGHEFFDGIMLKTPEARVEALGAFTRKMVEIDPDSIIITPTDAWNICMLYTHPESCPTASDVLDAVLAREK